MPRTIKKRPFTKFRTRVFSRHPSHSELRLQLILLPFRSVVRLGSTTVSKPGRIECNTVDAIRNSADKLRMKECFQKASVVTAKWCKLTDTKSLAQLEYPVIVKHRRSSRGEGIYRIQNAEELTAWKQGKTLDNYIVEEFHDFNREYRLHVTKNGCFYTCRKVLKAETPNDKRWLRNDSTCNWIMPENPLFDRPVNWKTIEQECVKALNAVGLDIGACDLKVQSAQNSKGQQREAPKFIVIEINSAPSFGERTLTSYLLEIPKILKAKFVK